VIFKSHQKPIKSHGFAPEKYPEIFIANLGDFDG
jgi:hypothetical protein